MLPTRMIKRHIRNLEDPELDQLLVSLYQIHERETRSESLPPEERMQSFRAWLERHLVLKNEDFETRKIDGFFQEELEMLRPIWEEVRGMITTGGKGE